MTAPELTAAEAARVAAIEAAPAAEEALIERMAAAIADTTAEHGGYSFPCRCGWLNTMGRGWEDRANHHRLTETATAALAVVRGEVQ